MPASYRTRGVTAKAPARANRTCSLGCTCGCGCGCGCQGQLTCAAPHAEEVCAAVHEICVLACPFVHPHVRVDLSVRAHAPCMCNCVRNMTPVARNVFFFCVFVCFAFRRRLKIIHVYSTALARTLARTHARTGTHFEHKALSVAIEDGARVVAPRIRCEASKDLRRVRSVWRVERKGATRGCRPGFRMEACAS